MWCNRKNMGLWSSDFRFSSSFAPNWQNNPEQITSAFWASASSLVTIEVETVILKFPPSFYSFLWLSLCILLSSVVRISVAVLGTHEPYLGTIAWLLIALMKEIGFVESQGWVLCQSQFLFLAFSTMTPSSHNRTERRKWVGSNLIGKTEDSVKLLCPLHPIQPEPYLQTPLERLGLNCFPFLFIRFYGPSCISLIQILFI